MISRQFHRLLSGPKEVHEELLVEGLLKIADAVAHIVHELESAQGLGLCRATRLLRNVGREEAGKFLLLLDVFRSGRLSQRERSDHLRRAGDHLPKLLYAQMTDYAIGSRTEMARALETHRRELYLDGLNDYDYIMRNDLISEREDTLYTDLQDVEGSLQWWSFPFEEIGPESPAASMYLTVALADSGLVSREGFRALADAWKDFDPTAETYHSEWVERNSLALSRLSAVPAATRFSRYLPEWTMPLTHFDLGPIAVSVQELQQKRDAEYADWVRREFGWE